MVDILSMVDLTSISAMLAAIGVFVGVVFAILELRDLVRTRQTDLVTSIYSTVSTREYLEAWEKFRDREITDLNEYKKKHGLIELNIVMTRYDQIGALLRRKLIDVELVQDLFGPTAISIWEKLKKPILEDEKRLGKPHVWKAVEYLYNEMQKREQQLTNK